MKQVKITYQPIRQWSRKETRDRQRSQFDVGYEDTVEKLQKELRLIGARTAVISLYIDSRDIRSDGGVYASVKPVKPHVILSFKSNHGQLEYQCDKFSSWHENLRAITLTLERLRMAELYDCTNGGAQYTGFAALPAP